MRHLSYSLSPLQSESDQNRTNLETHVSQHKIVRIFEQMYVDVYQDWLITSMMLKLHSLRLRQQRRQDSLTGKINENIVGEEVAILNVMIVVTLTIIEAIMSIAQIRTAMGLPCG